MEYAVAIKGLIALHLLWAVALLFRHVFRHNLKEGDRVNVSSKDEIVACEIIRVTEDSVMVKRLDNQFRFIVSKNKVFMYDSRE